MVDAFGTGVLDAARPDLVPGKEAWLDDPLAPGGRRLNREAFAVPPQARQGTLGRNALRGFGVAEVSKRWFRMRDTYGARTERGVASEIAPGSIRRRGKCGRTAR